MLKTVGNPSTRYGDQTIVDGSIIIGTSGKGIDFSATGHAAGMTSKLLDDYEEGTWTPVDTSSAGLIFASALGIYKKVGRIIYVSCAIVFPTTANGSNVSIGGLPFASQSTGSLQHVGAILKASGAEACTYLSNNSTDIKLYPQNSFSALTNANMSGVSFIASMTYTTN